MLINLPECPKCGNTDLVADREVLLNKTQTTVRFYACQCGTRFTYMVPRLPMPITLLADEKPQPPLSE